MTNIKADKAARMRMDDRLTAGKYNLLIGGCLVYGFALNALIVGTCSRFFIGMNPIILLVGYFVLCIAGIALSRSTDPAKSFLGYNLVVVPIGAVLSVSLGAYYTADILSAIVVTGAVVAIMMGLSAAFPKLFAKLGGALGVALFVSLIAQLIAMLFGYGGQIFNWIFVVIFSLYIGYDWHKAQMYAKTVDNAIDSALDLYLDIINLFLRILQIMSRSRD